MITELFFGNTQLFYVAVYGVSIVSLLVLFFFILSISKKNKRRKYIETAAEYVLLQVTQTPNNEARAGDVEEIRLFEDLLAAIVPEKKPIAFEVAIASGETDIRFFIASPPEYVDAIRDQVRRVFERAQIQEVDDYNIFDPESNSILANAQLKKFYGLPIRTYQKSGNDTFSSIVTSFAAAKEKGTGMSLQIILQRAPKSALQEISKVITGLRSGKKLNQIKPESAADSVIKTLDAIGSAAEVLSNDSNNTSKSEKSVDDGQDVQSMEEKKQGMLYRTNIRIGVSAQTQEKMNLLFDNLKQRFVQFGTSGFNSFVFMKRKDKQAIIDFSFRLANQNTATILSGEEVSSIFHFLNQNIEVANVQWEKTKRVAAPTELGTQGVFLGDNIFHGRETPIYIPEKDRMRHLYIIGQTGTGKTAIIKSIAYQDIQNDKGICIIDPHGDLVDDILGVIPEHRLDDVILFDPSNIKNPIAINMLEYNRKQPEEKTFIIDEILSIFQTLFSAESMGPAFEQYLRNSLLLLMEGKIDEPATLLEVPRVFTNDAFRASLLKNCTIEQVRQFWQEEAEKVEGDWSLNNIAPYITSKFSNFISNDYIRPIIGQPYSSFSFREAMDSGKILLVKLSQGKIGKINAKLMGMIVTSKIALAALGRDNIPKEDRRDFYFYIDEFQNFTTDSISKILAEARKYELSLTIAHQYMAQLTDDIRGAVLGNVGSVIAFRVGIEDAEVLQKKFAPKFSALELAEIENLNCVVSMLSNNKPISPFTMQIRFAPKGPQEIKDLITQYSSLKHTPKV